MEQDQHTPPKRAKVAENQVAPHQPPPPQKCPRCESLNTKFCYYNNYNLSQPRYICKACKRYWTHGGTLRNVPVGGGSRKGRRGRVSPISNGESSRSRPFRQPPPPEPSQQPQVQFPNVNDMAAMVSGIAGLSANESLRNISWAHPPITGSTYTGGIFAAFEGMQNMLPLSQTQGINNQPIRIGGTGSGGDGDGANMSIFSGFNFSSMKSQQDQAQPLEIQQPGQFDGIGNRNKNKEPMYTPADENLVLPAGNLNFWTRGNSINTIASTSNSNLWNNSSGASTSNSMTDQSSFNANQWPNFLDRFDAPQ